ncbi:MAG: hypothetical protein ACXVY6_13545 [Gaiellaceae bacterium]
MRPSCASTRAICSSSPTRSTPATKHGYGTAAGQRQRAAEIRAMADVIDAQFGKGPAARYAAWYGI